MMNQLTPEFRKLSDDIRTVNSNVVDDERGLFKAVWDMFLLSKVKHFFRDLGF